MTEPKQHYTFGDSDLAAQRLRLLAETYEPSTRRWLAELALPRGTSVIDLGCGPGYTTRVLADELAPARLIGLDRSEQLLALARQVVPDSARAELIQHDVTLSPFPVPPADILYARFLITHLREPERVLQAWSDATAPGGFVVLEETASMEAEHPALARYYELVAALQAHYGQRLDIGKSLTALAAGTPLTVVRSEARVLELDASRMARIHAMNLKTWRTDPYASTAFDAAELDRLDTRLQAIASGDEPATPVRNTLQGALLHKR